MVNFLYCVDSLFTISSIFDLKILLNHAMQF